MRITVLLPFVLGLAGCEAILGIQDPELAPESGALSDSGVCAAGSLVCSGNTPQRCVVGSWQNLTPCGGVTPTCSNGVCGTFRTTGGIRSSAPVPLADGGVHLVSGGFELGPRTCDHTGVCLTGGIVP
jgi:hypothetical protein